MRVKAFAWVCCWVPEQALIFQVCIMMQLQVENERVEINDLH